MDKTESENQIEYWYELKFGVDSNMDSDVYLSDFGLSEIPVKAKEKYAADVKTVTVKFI